MADEQTEEIPTQDTTEEQPTEAEQATTQEETAPPAEDNAEQQAAQQVKPYILPIDTAPILMPPPISLCGVSCIEIISPILK